MKSKVSITRPANTTAYTAGDVVGDVTSGGVIRFPGFGPGTGREVLITSASLEVDVTAVPAGMTSFRLHLYRVTAPSAFADNAEWNLPSGDRADYLGYIDLGSPAVMGITNKTLFVQTDQINKHLRTGAGEDAIYGYLVSAGGFTPAANSEVYAVTLFGVAL
jgi:hypothetical protein